MEYCPWYSSFLLEIISENQTDTDLTYKWCSWLLSLLLKHLQTDFFHLFCFYFFHSFKEGVYHHGTIMRTEITCKKILLWKPIEFGMAMKYIATRHKQKTEIFLVTRPPTCWKPDSCFWFVRKDKKRIKANL